MGFSLKKMTGDGGARQLCLKIDSFLARINQPLLLAVARW
jgi:hypothetical protein